MVLGILKLEQNQCADKDRQYKLLRILWRLKKNRYSRIYTVRKKMLEIEGQQFE